MNASDSPALGAPAVAVLLAETPFAAVLRSGAPLLLAGTEPTRLVFASDSALALFRARNLAELGEAAVGGPSPGAKRLRELGRVLAVGASPRLELLRFFAGRKPLMIGLSCARIRDAVGSEFIVAASLASTQARAAPPSPCQENVDPALASLPAAAAPIATTADVPAAAGDRFLWSVDEDLRFGAPAQAFAKALGAHAPQERESLRALKTRTGLDEDGRLEAALAAKATFGALRVAWPLAAGAAASVVLLSGAPLFDRERRFLGFRGFGRVAGANAPTADLLARAAPANGEAPEEDVTPISSSPEAPASGGETESALTPALAEPTGPSAEIVQLRPAALSLAGAQNVVPIRPDLRGFAPPEETRRGDGEASVELTQSERNAFREIARALGAKVRADDFEAPNAEASDDSEASPNPAGDLGPIAELDAARLVDRLPIGALVARGDEALFLNRTLLDLLGYADLDHFHSLSNLPHLLADRGAESLGPTAKPIALTAADGQSIAVEGLVQTIEWRGAAATLFSFRRSAAAEIAPRVRALETEARELAAILDAAADGVLILDRDGAILSLNRSGEALLGVDHREIAGQDFTTLLAPESREAAKASFEGLRASGLDSLVEEGRERLGLTKQGQATPLFVTMARIGTAADAKFCVVLRDMTRWKEAERDLHDARLQAERASALKSEFLAKISHEIRTPLNAIIGFAEVIMEERFGPVGNERYKDYVKDIHASGGHVMSLVNDLLDLSKIEAGKADLKFAPIDANLIIQECLALMQPQAANERVIMRLSLAERLPRVVADERSLRQIMLNLMSNAVKFNEPGGQVIVSTALNDSGQAVIRVRDTGVGMSEGEIATALEPFRQVGATRRTGGTGLGLPLTKALTEANRAQFSIKSGKEQGTLVELAFPTTPAAAAQ
jgi:PAS domain S-box-containing protein